MTLHRGTGIHRVLWQAALFVAIALAASGASAKGENAPEPASRPATTEPSTRPAQIDPHIADLVADLGDGDFSVRERAGEQLLASGSSALIALSRATHSEDPEVRARANRLLAKIDWALPTDPRSVSSALEGYGARDVAFRRRTVRALASYVGPDSVPAWRALGRILLCDRDADVQWEVITQIRIRPNLVRDLGLGLMETRYTPPAAKALAARGYLRRLPQRAIQFFLMSLEEDAAAERPARDRTEILFVVRDVLKLARTSHGELRAAAVLRQQFRLAAENQRPWLTRELYALYASGGSLKNLPADLSQMPPNFSDSATLYAVARMERRIGYPDLARWMENRAFDAPRLRYPAFDKDASYAEITARSDVARFLIEHAWYDAAERELDEVTRTAPETAMLPRINAHLYLHTVAAKTHRERLAAEHIQQALELIEKSGLTTLQITSDGSQMLSDPKQNLTAMMHVEFLHAAQQSRDMDGILEHAMALAALRPINAELLLELYPILKRSGHDAEAQDLFDANYNDLKARIAVIGPVAESLARLAGMSAACGQHLDEAQAAARQALALEPANPAMLAMFAEVEYRAGQFDEAVSAEAKAVKLRPDIAVYKTSLERYRLAQVRARVNDVSTPPGQAPY